jgi:prepilin-type N-terminal cleavage/methylation domain-containing protein
MTTSPTGNKYPLLPRPFRNPKGFTFIEIMTTLAVLGGGIVMLYKSFFLSLDYQNHLAYRVYASNLLEDKISVTEQMARDYKVLAFKKDEENEDVVFNNKPMSFHVDVKVAPVPEVPSLYQLDVKVSWKEQKRDVTMSRTAYLSNMTSIRDPKS